jgi:putrescine aminotransferase
MERENLPGRVRDDVGPYLAQALKRLDSHPLVGETRSLGLLGAVEIVSEPGTNQRWGGAEGNAGPVVRDRCIDNGLMVRGIRDTIVMCPPLIIERSQIDDMVAIIAKSLDVALPILKGMNF